MEAHVSDLAPSRNVLSCTCRGTMPFDPAALGDACGGRAASAELCGADLPRFRAALGDPDVLVTCTQETAIFRAEHAAAGAAGALRFVNIREAAGWSDEAPAALPKIAALVAAASVTSGEPPLVTQRSDGVLLIYGRDEQALEAAEQLRDQLDITVMLTGDAVVMPSSRADYPVVRGTIRQARGHLGAFALTIDGFARALPSSRASFRFDPPRDGATSRCDLILDLTDGTPLFPAHTRRDGYLRRDPGDAVALQRAITMLAGLTGTFDKPRYVSLEPARCAHGRNGRIGCTRCLDACPTGAITVSGTPAADAVTIDPQTCAGCGTCVAICPTTAIRWTAPDSRTTVNRLRALLTTYRDHAAQRAAPVLLIHDSSHGENLIEALARAGDGLPAHVLPFCEPRVPGLDLLAAAIAYGAAEVRLLTGQSSALDRDGLVREIALIDSLLTGLDLGEQRVALLATDDPFDLGEQLRAGPPRPAAASARFFAVGDKREITMQALNALVDAAPLPVAAVPLPPGAPIGRVKLAPGCTLCLSCVSVCPTSALRDGGDRPALLFVEDNCVQCGLCVATCPEQVITLEPRATFGAERRTALLLREEAPATCRSCGKPFGVKSSIDRVAERLIGTHWMFSDPAVAARLYMCADCRVIAQTRHGLDPYAGPPRPRTRTSDE